VRGEVYAGFSWENLREGEHVGHMCRCEDDIEMDLQEIGWEGVDWIDWDLWGTTKFRELSDWLRDS
jgi:hypothetical protein